MDIPALLAGLPARISEIPRLWAAKTPDVPALREQDGRGWSYAELSAAVDATAERLLALGIRPGDRLMVVGENCAAQVALIFAAAAIDAWIVNVNGRLSAREIDEFRRHSGARRLVYTCAVSPDAAAHGARDGAALEDSGIFGPWMIGALNEDATPEAVAAPNAEQVAALIYTTGTTGQSKGVMLSHRNLLYVAAVSSKLRGLAPSDRAYGVLPISHVYGLTSVMLGTLYAGACLHLAPRFTVAALLKAMQLERITILQGVPAMYARLLEARGGAEPPLETALRFIYAGGSPLDPQLKAEAQKLLGLPLHNGYGLTESGPTISQTRRESPRSDTSVGYPIPGVEARIVNRNGADATFGTAGELWVRGPGVMLGYYREPEQTAAVLDAGGWLNTGDMAMQAADHALFIVGRTKELIIRSGFNVYPLEVETVLNAHPSVTQSAVVGRTGADGNEDVIAFVELDPRQPADEAQLRAYLAGALSPYKCPSHIVIMQALPAAATGKILKGQLRQLAQDMPPQSQHKNQETKK